MRESSRCIKGFTLVELLIVIAIIAILALVALPALLKAQGSGRENAALQVIRSLRTGEEVFRSRSTFKPKRYGNLTELRADNESPIAEGGVEDQSGYTFQSTSDDMYQEHYTITATPPAGADLRSYTLFQNGVITQQ